ncbi:ganglioside GM2 activator-like [Dreissena polymorpha]|uniref:ganglioside GM2 activator-like n=1 Tax=Dreissena polymorpha TaxID=45954 RepID=UPI0022650559|nr:ganglioside GM2 activator-like [Dreissena polymorpha]
MQHIVCFVAALSLASATLKFQLHECHTQNPILHLSNPHLSADTVHIPGPETGDVDVQILRPVDGSYTLDVHVQTHVLFGFVDVPCISNLGSCSYDLCGILSGQQFNNTHHCPLEIAASSPDFPCACPFDAGNYHLNPTTFQIPELSGLLKWLASGDYKVHFTIKNTRTSEVVACYDVQFTTAADCSGISCLFGRKRVSKRNAFGVAFTVDI